MAWIMIWKILDLVSTYQLVSNPMARELSPFVTYLTPIIGFDMALFFTLPLALVFAYFFYYSLPVVVEVLAVYLPVAVIGNFSIYIHPVINNLIVVSGIASFLFYMAYYELKRRRTGRARDTIFLPTKSN